MSAAAPKDAAEMPRNAENASGQTAEPVHKKAKGQEGERQGPLAGAAERRL